MALDFPGANSNYLGNGNPIWALDASGTAITISAWIRPDAITSFRGILGKDNGAATTCQYDLYLNSGKLTFQIGDAAGIEAVIGATVFSTAGVWYHVAGRKAGTGAGALQCFVNGVLDGSATSNKTGQDLSNAAIIGNRTNNDLPFDGRIAEVAIWRTALNNNEIGALARGCPAVLVRPIGFASFRAYYPMWLSNTAADMSGQTGEFMGVSGSLPVADHAPVCPYAPF